MTHFVTICPEVPGHANSMSAVALELQRRGHEITWIGTLDGVSSVEQWGFRSLVVGEQEFPLGYLPRVMGELGRLKGLPAVRFTLGQYRLAIEVGLRDVPQRIRDNSVTTLLADESVFSARSLAEHLDLQWISLCSALPFHPDPDLPPTGPGWTYGTSWYHRIRNSLGTSLSRMALRSIHQVIRDFRTKHGLKPYDMMVENASRLATIAQVTREFDFPRSEVSEWFHYVGSLQQSKSRTPVEFPFSALNIDGAEQRPLVYASMGTLQNRLYPVFRNIAEACAACSTQLVISLGGGGKPSDLGELPGDPMVVEFAPQLELIERASLVITHAGMNTVTESIAAGVPMLAIPVTNDQPAVAARVARSGCGEMLPLRKATVRRIADSVRRILADDRYSARARALSQADRAAGGVQRAADIIEQAVA